MDAIRSLVNENTRVWHEGLQNASMGEFCGVKKGWMKVLFGGLPILKE